MCPTGYVSTLMTLDGIELAVCQKEEEGHGKGTKR